MRFKTCYIWAAGVRSQSKIIAAAVGFHAPRSSSRFPHSSRARQQEEELLVPLPPANIQSWSAVENAQNHHCVVLQMHFLKELLLSAPNLESNIIVLHQQWLEYNSETEIDNSEAVIEIKLQIMLHDVRHNFCESRLWRKCESSVVVADCYTHR